MQKTTLEDLVGVGVEDPSGEPMFCGSGEDGVGVAKGAMTVAGATTGAGVATVAGVITVAGVAIMAAAVTEAMTVTGTVAGGMAVSHR